jgi:hypothetical protein
VEPTKTKCNPGGMLLMPGNLGVVVKESKSMPPRAEGGRFSSRTAGVMVSIMNIEWFVERTSEECGRIYNLTTHPGSLCRVVVAWRRKY